MATTKFIKHILLTAGIAITSHANAASIGTYNFADNAVADQLVSGQGQFTNDGGIDWYYSSASNDNWFLSTGGSAWANSGAPTEATDNSGSSYLGVSNASGSLSLDFSQTSVINGAGSDIAFFFLWDQSNNLSDVTINGETAALTLSNVFDNQGAQQYAHGVNWQDSLQQNVILMAGTIDLDNFGFSANQALNSSISINLQSNGEFMALSSAVGLNTNINTVSAVPLPAPFILFLSGLAALGLIGRKRK